MKLPFRVSRAAAALSLAVLAAAAYAQEKPRAPLTRNELAASLGKAERVLVQALRLSQPASAPVAPTGGQPATRLQAVLGLYRLHQLAKPAHAFVPSPTRFEAARVKRLSDPVAQRRLLELLKWGYLAPVGPISAGPTDTLTLEGWGDALGYFLARVAELTHTPSARFSPPLMTDDGLPKPKPKR